MSLTSNVVRRGAVYYFRCRVPEHIREVYGRREFIRSLKTSNPSDAKRLGQQLAALMQQAWLAVGNGMKSKDIDKIIQRWFDQELKRDETSRMNLSPAIIEQAKIDGVAPSSLLNELIGSEAAIRESEWIDAANNSDWAKATTYVKAIIREQKLRITPDSPEFATLCRKFAGAAIELERIRLNRSQGDWNTKTTLFEGSASAPSVAVKATKPTGRPIKHCVRDYLREISIRKDLSEKALSGRKTALFALVDWLGEDFDIFAIDRRLMGKFKADLAALPPNFSKLRDKVSVREAAEKARTSGALGRNEATVNKDMSFLRGFFDWLISSGELTENPAQGIRERLPGKSKETVPRATFTDKEIQRVFGSPLFTGCESDKHVLRPGTHQIKDWRKWLFPMLAYTGARLGEICQLRPEDLVKEEGYWFFQIDTTGGRSVKTKSSIRKVPVHQDLIELGVLKLRDNQIALKAKRLLPGLPDGDATNMASKWGLRVLTGILGNENADGEKYVLHGFRHTLISKLRAAPGIEDSVIKRIVGHAAGDVHSRYGKEAPKRLTDAINAVDFRASLMGAESGRPDTRRRVKAR